MFSVSRIWPKPRFFSVANDVDEPVEGMQAAQEIIVLAVAERQECREIPEADPLQALDAIEPLLQQCTGNRIDLGEL